MLPKLAVSAASTEARGCQWECGHLATGYLLATRILLKGETGVLGIEA